MPADWDLGALRAQAVTARTYALATRKTDDIFDVYPDTRSQVYRGVSGETRALQPGGPGHRGPDPHLPG